MAAGRTITFTAVVHDPEGRASSALTANDFTVSEGSQPKTISLFRTLRPSQELIVKRVPREYTISNRPLAAMGSKQPVNVMILDTRNTDPEFQPWMRSQALRLISILRPDSDITLYQLAGSGLRLLHEFSHDKSQLANALAAVGEPATADEFERESAAGALRLKRYQETCEAVSAMAKYLGHFEQRKNLLWMSGDFPPVFEAGNKRTEDASPSCSKMALELNRSNTSLYPVEVRSPVPKEPFQRVAPGDLQAVPRNRRRVLSREWLVTMTNLAALTGGRAIENRNQLAEAMVDALAETRFAYELGFDIPEAECDGGLHALHTEVKMRDATVLAKQAFVSDCDIRQTRDVFAQPFDSAGIGLTVMPTFQSGTESRVQVKVLIAPADLQWSKAGEKWLASVKITSEGRTADGGGTVLASQTVPFAFPTETHEPLMAELIVKPHTSAQILRVVVRDQANQRQGSVTFPLTNKPQ